MKRATVLLRPGRTYRREMFEQGLAELGYRIEPGHLRNPGAEDVLVLWNRNRAHDSIATLYESRGARVLIAENGYLPIDDEKAYALALSRHNGAGEWHPRPELRFPISTAPWRRDGDHVLVLAQRGIGSQGVRQPTSWPRRIVERLGHMTDRPIRVRSHPGVRPERRTLEQEIVDAWAAVTWASGAGIKALCAGVPVFFGMDRWIGAPAARPVFGIETLEEPFCGDRAPMLRQLSWAQWRPSEIESGEAFRHLLEDRA